MRFDEAWFVRGTRLTTLEATFARAVPVRFLTPDCASPSSASTFGCVGWKARALPGTMESTGQGSPVAS